MRGVHYHALRRTWTIHVDYTWLVFLVEDCAGEFTHHNSQGTREATRRGAVEGKGKGGRCIEPQPPSTQNDSNPTAGTIRHSRFWLSGLFASRRWAPSDFGRAFTKGTARSQGWLERERLRLGHQTRGRKGPSGGGGT